MDTNCAAAMVAEVDPVTEPDFAETVIEPCLTAVRRPLALIVAIVGSELVQSAFDRDLVDPSE